MSDPDQVANLATAGHNRGPPLEDEHVPEWGRDGIGNYFYWKAAYNKARKSVSHNVALFRLEKAERLGLTYDEYALELLERGRHLQREDVERIAAIKRKRPGGKTLNSGSDRT